MTGRKAMKQALDPFGWVAADEVSEHFRSVSCGTIYRDPGEGRVPLYAAPVGFFCLTKQEILDIVDDHTEKVDGLPMLYRDQAADLARAIEARLKDKNAY